MNAPRPTNTIAAVAFMAAVVIVGILGVVGTTETTDQSSTFDYDPADHPEGAAVVTGVRTSEGFTLFGLRFRDPGYHIRIAFTVPEACADQILDLGNWPPADSGCRGPVATAGTVVGEGRAATGDLIVAIETGTTAACFSSAEPGMTWPIDASSCASS